MAAVSRICRIGTNTFLEAVRQKFFTFLLLIALALLGSVTYFQKFDFGASELNFITDFGTGAIVFFGSILSIVMMAQLFFNEVENRTALTMLSKPVRRWEFLAGKFVGVAWLLGVFILLMTIVLGGFLYIREGQLMERLPEQFKNITLVHFDGLILYAWTQWLKYCVLMAITLFICSFSNTNLFSVIMSFMVLIICQIQYVALDSWRSIDSPVVSALIWVFAKIFPNFQMYNLVPLTVLPQKGVVAWGLGAEVTLYSVIYVLVFFGLAVYSFRRREI